MERDPTMSAMVKRTGVGRGKRFVIIFAALFVVVALIAVVAAGFRNRHISQNAAAMTTPLAPAPAKVAWKPWWLP
jgi:Mn2+/Fe2+ NRAMP family transporter